MIEINSPHEIEKHLNTPLTPSDWYEVTQEKINIFAEATGDFQWIHVDVERAKKEMPEGKTIAHGYYMLSLIPLLSSQTAKINNSSRTLNYGSDKVRYINPVKVDSLVRLNRKIIKVNLMENGGYRMINLYEMEIKDAKKPAYIAETISLVFP
ncbi:MAG: enoyl-CoA hydratase [Rhodobacterales bacterium]|nr:enoyl-CoA hydratase [Rhodobacterales bacterium]|tara:strand:+ start:719 stop:1177 length:459 start_codon:yes stop_codon:yes gene_type:complete